MARIINDTTCETAYIEACNQLLASNKFSLSNLIIEITSPTNFTNLVYCLQNRNPWRINSKFDNMRQVINTIFPFRLESYFANRADFYDKYKGIYKDGKDRKWGTYFQRFIMFGKHYDNFAPNQLENIINSLNGKSPQKYYTTLHTTAVNVDSNVRPLGGPCLQYVQFNKGINNELDLIAVYRNQDYFNKALGNFYGLAFLLDFVAKHTPFTAGTMTIHSIHAYSSQGKSRLKSLLL